jgi:hypothetical protein
MDILFPEPELTYYPQVVASIEHTNDIEDVVDIYGISVQNVSTTGFSAIFTGPITYPNFYLTAFISPNYNVNSFIN